MTQIGEPIDFQVFVSSDNAHEESTCPWPHQAATPSPAPPMDPQMADEDAFGPMPANLGKKLGDNLGDGSKPGATGVWLYYRRDAKVHYWTGKAQVANEVQTYSRSGFKQQHYPLQYAPHHLIPGNESLKGSRLVPLMGDDSVIKAYGKGSKLRDGESIRYDVNARENGVWLPSPYALSNSNQWPSIEGIKVVLKRNGQFAAQELEDFKDAYAAASIEASGGRQFHMRHDVYSAEVRNALNAISNKLDTLAKACEHAKADDGKFKAPSGLKTRLNALSSRLNMLLTGPVWHEPFFADNHAGPAYLVGRVRMLGAHGIEPIL